MVLQREKKGERPTEWEMKTEPSKKKKKFKLKTNKWNQA